MATLSNRRNDAAAKDFEGINFHSVEDLKSSALADPAS